jgi:D-glycero-D-manno-heptose 1,7-bisphosphate phosphatase
VPSVALALLDRDGTLNLKPPDGGWVTEPGGLTLLPGAAEAVRALNDAGITVAVVTNQRCVTLGLVDAAGIAAIHRELERALRAEAGAHVDAIHVCPHADGECSCRKPLPGLLADAAAALGIDAAHSVMIGDADTDVEAGRRFGARTIQLTDGPSAADATAPTLLDAVRGLLGGSRDERSPS